MTYPTRWTVQHERFSGVTEDSRGNTIPAYAPAVTRDVYGWASPATRQSAEPKVAGIESVVVLLELYAPTFSVGDRDRMVVGGVTYEVVGDPEVYDHGPFGFEPGMVVNLTRGR